MDDGTSDHAGVIAFGEFRLDPARRLLERAGVPLPLGGRALHMLIALAERAGQIVTKQELLDIVWPDVTVEEGSLRFHMVAMRKALGEGRDGRRFISTIPNRGYCFVAHVDGPAPAPERAAPVADRAPPLPVRLDRMIGREEAVAEIAALLADNRLVSIVAPGGIGKTTVAVAVGHAVGDVFDAVRFVDLGLISDPARVLGAAAAALGLRVQAPDVASVLEGHLRRARVLLIFDNCEHLVDAVADLTERIVAEASGSAVLATSREALRIEGERVYRLPALAVPPVDQPLTVATLNDFPATRLFVERAAASGGVAISTDEDAAIVVDICRKLDGMALAIELAAGRVAVLGLKGLSDVLGGRIRLLWRGRRTAPARQHTLSATLDWSYNLLTTVEQRVLDRFSVFVGGCSLEAAQVVIADDEFDGSVVIETIAALVEKSLVSTSTTSGGRRYDLLQTTRAYLEARRAFGGDEGVPRRHAVYYRDLLRRLAAADARTTRGVTDYGEHLGNIRSALEWSFSPDGDAVLGIDLAIASAAVFQELSLLEECQLWSARALEELDDASLGTLRELDLRAAHGLSMMFTEGNGDGVRGELSRAVDLARRLGERHRELQALARLNTFETRVCRFEASVLTARRSEVVARELGEPSAIAMACWMLGVSLHGYGDQGAAEAYCEAAMGDAPEYVRADKRHLSSDYRLRAISSLARCLWLKSCTRRAFSIVRRGLMEAAEFNDPLASNINAMYMAPVSIWMHRWDDAGQLIEWQIPHAERHGWAPYVAVGLGQRGELQVRRGDVDAGIATLEDCLARLRAERLNIWLGTFLSALAEGHLARGDAVRARLAMDEAMAQLDAGGETWFSPEVLRVAARAASARTGGDAEAESLLERSLSLARRQSALAWELRAATDLASLRRRHGRDDEALALLKPLYQRYDVEDHTPDLKAAAELLHELGWTSPCGGGRFLPPLIFSHEG